MSPPVWLAPLYVGHELGMDYLGVFIFAFVLVSYVTFKALDGL